MLSRMPLCVVHLARLAAMQFRGQALVVAEVQKAIDKKAVSPHGLTGQGMSVVRTGRPSLMYYAESMRTQT
jgi:hypothetical protein